VTRFVDRLEDAGMLNDRVQHEAIQSLLAEHECDYYKPLARTPDGTVEVDLCRWADDSPVRTCRVGLAGEIKVYVSEVIA
jgi:hypothetical protein